MKITVLPVTDGLTHVIADVRQAGMQHTAAELTVVASTLTDVTVHGLRFCPDIDACLIPPTSPVPGGAAAELAAFRVDAEWFPMNDRQLAAAVLRSRLMGLGYGLSAVTQAMTKRYAPDFTVLPLTDTAVETMAVVSGPQSDEAWPARRYIAQRRTDAKRIVRSGFDDAKAAPGVLKSIREADVVIFAVDERPEFTAAPALSLPGMVDALSGTRARVLTIGADRLDEETRALLGGEEADAKLEELLAEAASARPEDGLSTVWG
ncbi:2-phospho-L-lactate transferase CofD family protein [Brevibacterium sp. HMSC07C04]|uniref:2-phospho-L-lactate transferase CofD family protein n=1 Tax=Brevibacterium sp. HMSC07C04 TaxID=1581130 RepID=UPI0008A3992B|nr:2-phospho-L-lactate transferase CofD family protein [Brevibacterium sp. HMSC07C04]OFS26740.1 hypothetical protein HMPREF3162_04765 [Brevibacterium sp. HMSC07C04]